MLASERASGCKLDLDLSSANTVIKQRGTISGALPKDGGFYFDGTNDYIQYILGSEFYSDAISYVIEFTPEFNWDENVIRTLFDTTDVASAATKRFAIYKYDASTTYDLQLQVGSTNYSIPSAVYSAYWKQNKKNTIVVSATGSNVTVYLNGIKIVNNVALVFTRKYPSRLHLGELYLPGLGYSFKGLIHSFKVYNRALSDQECLDYCNNATFLYEQRATIILPMRLQDHDPTNLKTLDVSGHGYHATFGDGVTPTTYPTKLTGKRGYSFDGSTDYLSFPASLNGVFTGVFQNPFTLIIVNSGYKPNTTNPFFSKGNDSDDAIYIESAYYDPARYPILYSKGSSGIAYGSICSICGRGFRFLFFNQKSMLTINEQYIYEQLMLKNSASKEFTTTFIENNKQLYIGKWRFTYFLGNMYYFALYPFSLTQIQMADVYIKLLQDINHE
jgi:hypothetical protein